MLSSNTSSFTLEKDIDEYLKEAVSIPYLQKIDSTGVIHVDPEIEDNSKTSNNVISKSNWSPVKTNVDPSLRKQFESIVTQMIQLGPKLGLLFQGSEEENMDSMLDTMNYHVKNLKAEGGKLT